MATSLIALGFTTDMAHCRSCRDTVTSPFSCWSDGWWALPSARLSACRPAGKTVHTLKSFIAFKEEEMVNLSPKSHSVRTGGGKMH